MKPRRVVEVEVGIYAGFQVFHCFIAFKDVFDNENRLRKLFDEGKISEAEFLERRVNDVKPHMDNLHSWLLEKKQKEMILDSSKTKEAVNY